MLVTRPLLWVASRVVPILYTSYMGLVWATSRVRIDDTPGALDVLGRYNGALGLFWHEEVVAAPYAYYRMGIRGHTLINQSDIGDLITRVVERLEYVVFRGGSSSKRSRRNPRVLRDMTDHMNDTDKVFYGIAVDGSHGPAYRLKRGALLIARDCGKPILLGRVWFSRCIRLPTWDRMAIPLPFKRIDVYFRGPYFVPKNERLRAIEDLRGRIEGDLIQLSVESYKEFGQTPPANLLAEGERGCQRIEP